MAMDAGGKAVSEEGPKSKMAVHDLIWSDATYSSKSLMANYSDKFPIIVMVTRGFYGQDDMGTLASCQVARLHTWVTQPRVLAHDARGRMLSIPLNYEIGFQVIDKKGKRGRTRSLKSIIDDHKLPVTVQFERKRTYRFNIGSVRYSSRNFGNMEIQRQYEEQFLKGNTIHEGIIDDKVMLVPMYIRVRFKVARGLKGHPEEDWINLQDMYSRAVRNTHVERIDGTKDIMLYPNKVSLPDDDKQTEDVDDDEVTDANANLTNAVDKEGSVKSAGKKSRSRSRSSSRDSRKHTSHTVDISNKDEDIQLQSNSTLMMTINKEEAARQARHSSTAYRVTSDVSDISSMSGEDFHRGQRHQNVVRVNLTDDSEVVTNELFPNDVYHDSYGRRSPSHGSTIITVTHDDMAIGPRHSYATYSNPTHSMRRAFSDEFLADTSVFYPSNTTYVDPVPNYTTSRRYRPSYTSFGSSDGPRMSRSINRSKYGMRLMGGAPVDRRYTSLKDLSSAEVQSSRVQYVQESEPVQRYYSIRSATLSPSPPPSQLSNYNYNPQNHFQVRIKDEEPPPANYIAVLRSSAPPLSPPLPRQEQSYNQGVYYTDGNQNYTVKNTKRSVPRPAPPSYEDLDFVRVIEEDYTHSDQNVYVPQHRPAVRHTALHSPVQSSSSGEESRRYAVAYNGSTTGTDEVDHSAQNEFIYQGTMTLRRQSLDDHIDIGNGSMFEVPVTDMRTVGRVEHTRVSTTDRAPVHASTHGQRREHAQTTVTRQENLDQHAFDSDGFMNGDVSSGQVDMSKGAAGHWARSMEVDAAYTSQEVPIEIEGRSGGHTGSMFEGGHHRGGHHSFTKDRNVCRRLDLQRQERNISHKSRTSEDRNHQNLGERRLYNNVIKVKHEPAQSYTTHSAGSEFSHRHAQKVEGQDSSDYRYHTTNVNGVSLGSGMEGYEDLGVARIVTEGESSAMLDNAMKEQFSSSGATESSALIERSEVEEAVEGSTGYTTTTTTTTVKKEEPVPREKVSSYVERISTATSGIGTQDGRHSILNGSAIRASYPKGDTKSSRDMTTSYTTTTTTVESSDHIEREKEREEREREALINTRISRKLGRELTRSGSVNSLREVYARSRSPSGERQAKPTMAVAPVTDVFEDILNRPVSGAGAGTSETTTTTTTTTREQSPYPVTAANASETTQVVRRSRADGRPAIRDHVNSGTSSKMFDTRDLDRNDQPGEELAWQETQSYHLESIRDSIRDLDEYLKDQGGESDSHSLSSATSSKHLEHFSFALTDEVTSF